MLKADLHIHTNNSSGFQHESSCEQVLKKAISNKLNTIAITDHNNITGALKTRTIVKRKKLEISVIIGAEISTLSGHIIGLNLNENIKKFLRAEEAIDRIHEQGGIAIAAHPIPFFCSYFDQPNLKFDAVEIQFPSLFPFLKKYPLKIFNPKKHAEIGSSDAHHYNMVGSCYTLYNDNIIKSIKKRTTKAVRANIPVQQYFKSGTKIFMSGILKKM